MSLLPSRFALFLALLAGCSSTEPGRARSLAGGADASQARPVDPRPGKPGVGDEYYPGLGNGGYDVQHYALELDVDLASGWLEAEATIRAKALHDLSSFNLDLHVLDVEGVWVDGREADFDHEDRELCIEPPTPLRSGLPFEVRVKYGGVPELVPEPAMRILPGVGWMRGESGIYVLSECVGSQSWFPCNDHPTDKATFSFRVTADKPYIVAANGTCVEVIDAGERRTYVFESKDPMATYLATVNIAEFEVLELEGPGGLPMPIYHPTDATPEELAAFERQGEMVELFEELFGPYPFESLGAVISYESIPGALETQTLPVYGRGLPEPVVAHEVAHQWFGNCVSPARWKDMWLNEAFASYAEWLWFEHLQGPEALNERAQKTYRMLRRMKVGSTAEPGIERLFGPNVYVRGAFVLHMLRGRLGDELFFELLQTWVETYHDASVTTDDFLRLLARIDGEEARKFLEPWLYDAVIPVVAEFEE